MYLQVILRWGVQYGSAIIPKSTSLQHQQQNLDILNWELDSKDFELLSDIDYQIKYEIGDWAVGPDKPYQTVEQLWDNEVVSR